MRIDITITTSIKDDYGREISRAVAKHRTSSFEMEDEPVAVTRRFQAAMGVTKKLISAAVEAVLSESRT